MWCMHLHLVVPVLALKAYDHVGRLIELSFSKSGVVLYLWLLKQQSESSAGTSGSYQEPSQPVLLYLLPFPSMCSGCAVCTHQALGVLGARRPPPRLGARCHFTLYSWMSFFLSICPGQGFCTVWHTPQISLHAHPGRDNFFLREMLEVSLPCDTQHSLFHRRSCICIAHPHFLLEIHLLKIF